MGSTRPWIGVCIDHSELELEEEVDAVLVQTPHWNVRKGSCGGAPVVLHSCRLTALKQQLWAVALRTLEEFVAPCPHPNLVQFLGVVTPSEQPVRPSSCFPTEFIVTERLPSSLYEILHQDHVTLSRPEIALIAIQVLRGLRFLHGKQQTLGVCLTSRKVMLDGTSSVKLRRFGQELVLRTGKAPSQLSGAVANSMLKTVYEMAPAQRTPSTAASSTASVTSRVLFRPQDMPSDVSSDGFDGPALTSVEQDLFAFGVLLLEMCAREKPTDELFNRISCVAHMDPVFHRVLQMTLSLSGDRMAIEASASHRCRKKPMPVTAEGLLQILLANEQQHAIEGTQLSCSSFPSFVHANRYFAAREAEQIERKLQDREQRDELDLKRLAAVEKELVDEQKNFAVLVLQLEQSQHEREQEVKEVERLRSQLETQEQSNQQLCQQVQRLATEAQEQLDKMAVVQNALDEERQQVEKLRVARLADAEENQGLLFQILKLKDAKRQLITQKQDLEAQCAAISRQIGSEKEAMADLEGRLTQVIYRWEEEQRARRKVERQVEAVSKQLLEMEDERCKYSSILQECPTGDLDPKASLAYVLELKDKEVQELALRLQNALDDIAELQTRISHSQEDGRALCTEKEGLLVEQTKLKVQQCALQQQVEERDEEIAVWCKKFQGAQAQIKSLDARVANFEEELDRLEKKRADEEKARKLRRCLTPQCDAPKYLVGASGYCKGCEERPGSRESSTLSASSRSTHKQRHRRHRSWDAAANIGGLSIRNNSKNASIVELVRILREARDGDAVESPRDDSRGEECGQQQRQQVLGAVKQLAATLKEDETLKDDLPECLAIKAVLALMNRYSGELVLQLECCRCLSVVVFNHDRNRLIVVAEGAVDLVLAAMKRFSAEMKMQEVSCVLLTNLAHSSETNRRRILEAGGVDAVLQAMQTFPKHCGMQKRSCWALLTLAGSDFLCDNIATRGGLGAIIAAMLNYPADECVQHYGSWALVNLVSGSPRLRAFARCEGVIEVAEAAQACFPGHEGIQEKTDEILRLLG